MRRRAADPTHLPAPGIWAGRFGRRTAEAGLVFLALLAELLDALLLAGQGGGTVLASPAAPQRRAAVIVAVAAAGAARPPAGRAAGRGDRVTVRTEGEGSTEASLGPALTAALILGAAGRSLATGDNSSG